MRRFIPEGRYHDHESMRDDLCWYCSRPADCVDHYPPVSRQAEFHFWKGWLIRACTRCNLILSDQMHISLEIRKLYMLRELEERHLIQTLFVNGMHIDRIKELSDRGYRNLRTIRDEYKKQKERQIREYEEQYLTKKGKV